ncbi:glycosyltransferase family 15 protein [Kluyveromyces lactis]|uniref:KLLA0B09988p n=1 Tax=Kluyveromyces lactis (strain ATCC 8585 / CBS 2359 / DSM 70799 / NBRC 1267 / NRRL Y-1140 / WM37) TaxID=284590 RepID=Q6CVR6_KLULA|nr:uncharacterized protein KLLA0_B09988g [Kluyveromyces lactis]CAH02366.1 KLLA0B09988p [Kluyveromyces lactis]|eukprot:XP_451973.1 uncharacterized protein KLLA0_B09988g [Kluyveromyces lactis]
MSGILHNVQKRTSAIKTLLLVLFLFLVIYTMRIENVGKVKTGSRVDDSMESKDNRLEYMKSSDSQLPPVSLNRVLDQKWEKRYPFDAAGSGAVYDSVVHGTKDKPKACFVSLVRNEELWDLAKSISSVEDRFNNKFNYPWIFLNDEPFTEEFKERISAIVPNSQFGVIPKEHWSYPDYVSKERAAQTRIDMQDIIYGASESYRHMCRFQSGFFFQHPLLAEFDWYWRVEPSTELLCSIDYDIFQQMQDKDLGLGFVISIHEFVITIPTLWNTTRGFAEKHSEYIHNDNLLKFISDDGGDSYNLCHFWSNFEVANLNFYRSKAYTDYFDYLDRSGGFFYERWGDAPVHSIAASLFLPRNKLHFFQDIGYHHPPYNNCPFDSGIRAKGKCYCDPKTDFTFRDYACGIQYYEAQGIEKPFNWKDYSGRGY